MFVYLDKGIYLKKSCFFRSSKDRENSRARKDWNEGLHGNTYESRGVFRTEPNIFDGNFWENI